MFHNCLHAFCSGLLPLPLLTPPTFFLRQNVSGNLVSVSASLASRVVAWRLFYSLQMTEVRETETIHVSPKIQLPTRPGLKTTSTAASPHTRTTAPPADSERLLQADSRATEQFVSCGQRQLRQNTRGQYQHILSHASVFNVQLK